MTTTDYIAWIKKMVLKFQYKLFPSIKHHFCLDFKPHIETSLGQIMYVCFKKFVLQFTIELKPTIK